MFCSHFLSVSIIVAYISSLIFDLSDYLYSQARVLPTQTHSSMICVKEYSNGQTDEQTSQRTTNEKVALYNSIPSPSLTLAWSLIVSSPDHSSDTESAPSFRLQIKGFAKAQKGVVLPLEPGQQGAGGHCMTLVTRCLVADRVEREVNCVLTSSLIGSDRQSGLYNGIKPCTFEGTKKQSLSPWYPPFSDTPCCLGTLPSLKVGSNSRSVKMFPSQQKSSQSVK